MKVLWFTNTPPAAVNGGGKYNGGGWVDALSRSMPSSVNLAISYITTEKKPESVPDGISWYPVYNKYDTGRGDRLMKMLGFSMMERHWVLSSMLRVIDEFKPDVIEVSLPKEYMDSLHSIPVSLLCFIFRVFWASAGSVSCHPECPG